MEGHTVEITFEAELLASHTDERGAVSRLYRTPDGSLYVYFQDEEGSWLETGSPEAGGVSPALIRSWWPELAHALEE